MDNDIEKYTKDWRNVPVWPEKSTEELKKECAFCHVKNFCDVCAAGMKIAEAETVAQAERYRNEIARLNQTCLQCPDNGRNPERCTYYCQIGFEIHKYDCLLGNGSHKTWKTSYGSS